MLVLVLLQACSSAMTSLDASVCHTATPDDACFVHAQWAHSIGLHSHPEWYPGLTPTAATFEDVQRVMHNTPTELAKYGCAVPCHLPPWEDPTVNHRRREPPHASLHPFESESLAVGHALDTAELHDSARVLMLSGSEESWAFHFSSELHQRPSVASARRTPAGASGLTTPTSATGGASPAAMFVPFYASTYNDSAWARIAVPSNWEVSPLVSILRANACAMMTSIPSLRLLLYSPRMPTTCRRFSRPCCTDARLRRAYLCEYPLSV